MIKDIFTQEQLVLLEFDENKEITTEQLSKLLKIPYTTLQGHLSNLFIEGFISYHKVGRTKYWKLDNECSKKIRKALSRFKEELFKIKKITLKKQLDMIR